MPITTAYRSGIRMSRETHRSSRSSVGAAHAARPIPGQLGVQGLDGAAHFVHTGYALINRDPAVETGVAQRGENRVVVVEALADLAMPEHRGISVGVLLPAQVGEGIAGFEAP